MFPNGDTERVHDCWAFYLLSYNICLCNIIFDLGSQSTWLAFGKDLEEVKNGALEAQDTSILALKVKNYEGV